MSLTYGLSKDAQGTKEALYPPKTEIATLFDQFIKEKRFLANLSERTLEMYREIFERWEKYAGGLPTQQSLKDFLVALREHGFSVTTCNITVRGFNSFLSWLKENDHLKEPLRLKQIKAEKKVMRTFTDEQVKRLLAWRPDPQNKNDLRIYPLLCLLTDTGLRISEALSLKISKVDFNNLLLTVIGKGNKERVVPMSLELRKVLYRYYTRHRFSKFPSDVFFCTKNGTALSYRNAYRDLEKAFTEVGLSKDDIDGFFHQWRRKFAKSYVKNGGNVLYLQAALGHTSLQMTKQYVEVEAEDLKEAHLKTSLLSRLK